MDLKDQDQDSSLGSELGVSVSLSPQHHNTKLLTVCVETRNLEIYNFIWYCVLLMAAVERLESATLSLKHGRHTVCRKVQTLIRARKKKEESAEMIRHLKCIACAILCRCIARRPTCKQATRYYLTSPLSVRLNLFLQFRRWYQCCLSQLKGGHSHGAS